MAGSVLPRLDLERLSLDSFAGLPVAVLGLARSGIALTRFLVDHGADVTVYDALPPEALGAAVGALGDRRPRLLLGPEIDPRVALRGQALICTSPSVSSRFPTTEPRLRAALSAVEAEAKVPVMSEVDLFLRLCPARTIGVTGTKGKTTTASLIASVLEAGERPTHLGGNIGRPLIERVPAMRPGDRVVLELSELQLPTLSRGTDVAVYTHVTSDHLDRHGDVEGYRDVKRRLVELLPPGGVLVRNDDDPVVRAYETHPGRLTVPYTQGPPPPGGVGVSGGAIVARDVQRPARLDADPVDPGSIADAGSAEGDIAVLTLADIPLPGQHSVSNVLAAVGVGLLFGVAPEGIRGAVMRFPGVEHRLETVATVAGVRYVNDSQGTQPDAVIAAVRAFPQPLVLIAGGRSKHVPIAELARVVAERVTAAVLIGETADELAAAFRSAGLERVERADSMASAVRQATTIARAGTPSVVLLSPAAASFDMFRDYEARGAAFKTAVAEIAAEAGEPVAVHGSGSPSDAVEGPVDVDGTRRDDPTSQESPR
jgi:UDP-N-acetylmuramoylalanine--D-glutamate ligase